jgi:hypothetical protein
MEAHFPNKLAVIIAVVGTAPISFHSDSSEPSSSDARSHDLTNWGEAIRQAGASAAEVARFQAMIRALSWVELAEREDYVRMAPSDI